WLGIYPAPVLRRMEASSQLLVNRVQGAIKYFLLEPNDVTLDGREVGSSGRAVDERDPIHQKCRRKRAEQEIFDRALGRALAASIRTGEYVARNRHQLDPEEHDDEIPRRGQNHHA